MAPSDRVEEHDRLFTEAGASVFRNRPLTELGTFRLGGPAARVVECNTPEVLERVKNLCVDHEIPALLIGEGSNLLFSDEGWPGVLVRYAEGEQLPEAAGEGIWRVPASLNLQKLTDWATGQGWAGLEAFNGIPGTVGGAVVGNAGAWGVQMSQRLIEVRGFDAQGNPQIRPVEDCVFRYRDSRMKHEDFWVSEVTLKLERGDTDFLQHERDRILQLRAERHPDWKTEPCIGSFFRNLEPSSAAERRQAAGYFLEQAGAKGRKVGGAAVYTGHANILVKAASNCRAADVAALARELRAAVRQLHGIDLQREVRYLGRIEGEDVHPGFY